MLGAYICLQYLCLPDGFFHCILWSVLLCLFLWTLFWSLILSDVSIATPAFFPVHLLGLFFSNPLLTVCVGLLLWCGSFVGNIYTGHVFLSTQVAYFFWLEHLILLHLRLLLIGTYSLPFYSLHTCVPLSLTVFLPFVKAVPLAYLAVLVWWRCILLAFFCLRSSLFCLPFQLRALLDRVVFAFVFHYLEYFLSFPSGLEHFHWEVSCKSYWGSLACYFLFPPLLPLRSSLCLGILPF